MHAYRNLRMRAVHGMSVLLTVTFAAEVTVTGSTAPGSHDDSTYVWHHVTDDGFTFHFTAADSRQHEALLSQTRVSRSDITAFFDTAWISGFDLFLFPDRAALDRQWQRDWQVPDFHSECWMVASGVGHRLDFLSPRVWETEACEHDPSDSLELRLLLAHELTHVFHGQHNPVPTFDGLDSIGWFIEGLAVLVSGQLDSVRHADALEAVQKGAVPGSLSEMWSGRYRYAVCGSLVRFIDQTYGRATIRRLLTCTTESQILTALGLSADELIDHWKAALGK